MAGYVVTGEYVTLKVPSDGGPVVVGFYKGAPVPDGVSKESLDHHLSRGLIGKAEPTSEPEPTPRKTAAKA